MDIAALKHQLTQQEGRKTRPYLDTVGKTTWGVGRNVSDVDWSPDELVLVNQLIDLCLDNDIRKCIPYAKMYPWFTTLSDARQNVILNLLFNMGPTSFAQFHHFHQAASAGDWLAAVAALQNSKWHTQVKGRAVALENQLLSGSLP